MSRAPKPPAAFIPCTPPPAHPADHFELARAAVAENPANAPPHEVIASLMSTALLALPGVAPQRDPPLPQFIAVMTSKYWGPSPRKFGVSFLDTPDAETRRLILQHMNAISTRTCLSFAESRQGEIRLSRAGDGYWSYLGTDILSIPAGQPTMNLQGFTARTPESEYKRVVRHETLHSAGCPHEHMRRGIIARIDPAKAIAYGARAWGWSARTVTEQVLTPVEESSLMATPTAEQDSIMCYQFPGEITTDGKPIVGGSDITESDFAFMAKLYPPAETVKPQPKPPVKPPAPTDKGDDEPAIFAAMAIRQAATGQWNPIQLRGVAGLCDDMARTPGAAGTIMGFDASFPPSFFAPVRDRFRDLVRQGRSPSPAETARIFAAMSSAIRSSFPAAFHALTLASREVRECPTYMT